MKRLLLVSSFLALMSVPSFAQDGPNTKWFLSVGFGAQEHDKRLYGFPPRENLLERQPENFGTWQFGASVFRCVSNNEKLKLFTGIGLNSELSTFERPFDQNYKQEEGNDLLLYTNRYFQYLLQLPIKSKFRLGKKINLSIDLLPQLNFLTIAGNTNNDRGNYSWWGFGFYSFEINPGIEYSFSKFRLSLNYRAFQVKKIDRILFYYVLGDDRNKEPMEGKKVETHNPFKIWFSVSYFFK